jgi:hypothetical protein
VTLKYYNSSRLRTDWVLHSGRTSWTTDTYTPYECTTTATSGGSTARRSSPTQTCQGSSFLATPSFLLFSSFSLCIHLFSVHQLLCLRLHAHAQGNWFWMKSYAKHCLQLLIHKLLWRLLLDHLLGVNVCGLRNKKGESTLCSTMPEFVSI